MQEDYFKKWSAQTEDPVTKKPTSYYDKWVSKLPGTDSQSRESLGIQPPADPQFTVSYEAFKTQFVYGKYLKKGDPKKAWSNLKRQIPEFVKSLPQIASSISKLSPVEMSRQATSVLGGGPPKSALDEGSSLGQFEPQFEGAKSLFDLAAWIPKTLFGLANDPVEFIDNNPLDYIMLATAVGTPKLGAKIKARIRGKRPITAKEIKSWLDEMDMPEASAKIPPGYEWDLRGSVGRMQGHGLVPAYHPMWEVVSKNIESIDLPSRMPEPAPPSTIISPKRMITEGFSPEGALEAKLRGLEKTSARTPEQVVTWPEEIGRVKIESEIPRLDATLSESALTSGRKPGEIVTWVDELNLMRDQGVTDSGLIDKHMGFDLKKEMKESIGRMRGTTPPFEQVEQKRRAKIVEEVAAKTARTEKQGINIDPNEVPRTKYAQRREMAVKNVAANVEKLSEYARATDVPGAENGVVKFKEGGTMPVFAKEAASLMDRSIPDMNAGKTTWPATIERQGTPSVWAATAHPVVKKLFDDWHVKDKAWKKEYTNHKSAFTRPLQKELASAKENPTVASERLARYATGKQHLGPEKLEFHGKKLLTDADMTQTELSIYAKGRALTDKYIERANRVRQLAGQELIEPIENYWHFAVNMAEFRSMGYDLATAPSSVIKKHLSGTPLPEAIERKGSIEAPIHLDYFKVMDKYVHDLSKFIHITPVVAKIRAFNEGFRIPTGEIGEMGQPKYTTWFLHQDKPVTAKWMQDWGDRIAGKGDMSVLQDRAKFQRAAAKLNSNIAASVLSGSLRSALIQWSAIRGPLVETGPVHTIKGIARSLTPAGQKFIMQHSHLFGRNMDIHVADALNQATGGKLRNLRKAVTEKGLLPLQLFDMQTAKMAWASYYDFHTTRFIKSKRLSPKEAAAKANDGILRTQASGLMGDISPAQSGVVGRLATLFQTFSIAEWNWLMRDVVGIHNPEANLGQSVVRTVRFLTATALINELFEGQIGIPSPFPAPERAIIEGVANGDSTATTASNVALELMEGIPVVGPAIKFSQPWRATVPSPSIQSVSDIMQLAKRAIELDPSVLSAYSLEQIAKVAGLPGASQARKLVTGLQQGKSWPAALMGAKRKPGDGTKDQWR
jgi:hypothetical protein